MLLVLENEVNPDFRYFVREMRTYLPEHRVYDYANEGGNPSLSGVDGVIVAGSTAGVYERADYPWMDEEIQFVRELVAREIPTLGVCFGHQIVNHALGGSVEHRGLTNELVRADLADDPIFEAVSPVVPAVHGDHLVETGNGMETIASTKYNDHFATRHRDVPLWTMQFHPEFTERLYPRVSADFGWQENEDSFSDVNGEQVFENFARLVGVDENSDDREL
ncbi:GMP synthase (glutamine-hydrolysing) [Haladaptatus litoreus]|uniref:GMP synthase (Glutamine-hydrolysing) n=1 Tax=Haladaptatus litoreus TaxID=553468 RepID=A0A1N6Y4R3_9EURY|nr:type 1 glutamine amidotransferase [Haladaptatus litoreus]SIR09481.1 GMP synthase (glutamine-hydrolysing) [Haladaptatus litoreus]